jgi:hypothetical protein
MKAGQVDDGQAKLVEQMRRLKQGALLLLALLVPMLAASPAGAMRGPASAESPAVSAKATLAPSASMRADREEPGDPLDFDPSALPASPARLQPLFPWSAAHVPAVEAVPGGRACLGFRARAPPRA